MKVQAERNELKEYKIAEKEYPGQILNAGQHGVIIRKQRDAFIKGYKCKAAQSSPVKAAQPQQPKETKWSKLNTEMDSALNSLEFDKWAEAKEQPSGKVLENITDRQLNQIWSAVTEDWVFANFVEKFREVTEEQIPLAAQPVDKDETVFVFYCYEETYGTKERCEKKCGICIGVTKAPVDSSDKDTLDDLSALVIDAGQKYWDCYNNLQKGTDNYGRNAIVYVKNNETGQTFFFTRGEYSKDLISFIGNIKKVQW